MSGLISEVNVPVEVVESESEGEAVCWAPPTLDLLDLLGTCCQEAKEGKGGHRGGQLRLAGGLASIRRKRCHQKAHLWLAGKPSYLLHPEVL